MDDATLKTFFGNLRDRAIGPDHRFYVPLYERPGLSSSDPVADLQTCIEWSTDSTQLFSGFRGTGKSSELRRLEERLNGLGDTYKVVRCEMQEFLNLSTPIDISDFLICLAGALSDQLSAASLLGEDPARESYWTRFSAFLKRTKVAIDGLDAEAEGVSIKTSFKTDPTFKQQVQERLQGHLGGLVQDVRGFVQECRRQLEGKFGEDTKLVVILDSVEQIRGTSVNELDVFSSVETLFAGHADKLKFDFVHMVYTAPPWLTIKAPGVSGLFDGIRMIPCVKIREKDGSPSPAGIAALRQLVQQRGDWKPLFGSEAALDRLLLASGGYIRDLLRLMQQAVMRARRGDLPLSPEDLDLIENQVRDAYLPIAADDAHWLQSVGITHRAELREYEHLPSLARLFDHHLVLRYQNGSAWFGVHPLVEEHVKQICATHAEADSAAPEVTEAL